MRWVGMEYLIIVCMALFVICGVLGYLYLRRSSTEGRRFKATYGKFTATVIVDKAIPYENGHFYYSDKIISGKELAMACALGMHVTTWVMGCVRVP